MKRQSCLFQTYRQFGRSLVQEYADAYTYPFYVKLGV